MFMFWGEIYQYRSTKLSWGWWVSKAGLFGQVSWLRWRGSCERGSRWLFLVDEIKFAGALDFSMM